MQRLKVQLDARDAAARDARRKDSDDGEDFIPLDGKVPSSAPHFLEKVLVLLGALPLKRRSELDEIIHFHV